MIDLVLLLLPKALLCVEGKQYRYVVHALVAWAVDIVVAHTTWRALGGAPQKGEWTISDTLERLCHPSNSASPRYRLYVEIALEINRHSPTGDHIKIVLSL